MEVDRQRLEGSSPPFEAEWNEARLVASLAHLQRVHIQVGESGNA